MTLLIGKERATRALGEFSYRKVMAINNRLTLETVIVDKPEIEWASCATNNNIFIVSLVFLEGDREAANFQATVAVDSGKRETTLILRMPATDYEIFPGTVYNALAPLADRDGLPKLEREREWRISSDWEEATNESSVSLARVVEDNSGSPRAPILDMTEFANALKVVSGGNFVLRPQTPPLKSQP